MNIAKFLLKQQPIFKNQIFNKIQLQTQVIFNLTAERKSNVLTHKNEFLPFTFNNLWDNPGSRKQSRRVGRGPGSTKGKTGGYGENGQKKRSGGSIHPRFEGGQSSIVRRLPKMGMSIRNTERPNYINLSSILYYINKGTLNPNEPITIKALHDAGAFKTAKFGIKILGKGLNQLNQPLHLEVTDASEKVIQAIKEKGGSVTCHFKTRLLMREAVHPEKFPFKLRDPIPTVRNVRQMERIRSRGAEVFYKVPEWKQKEIDEEKKEIKEEQEFLQKTQEEKQKKKQNSKKEASTQQSEGEGETGVPTGDFQIPFPRHPGVGKNKIRKRKPTIWRTIDYGF